MEHLLIYKDMCRQAGFPEKPQLMWQVGVVLSAISTISEAVKVVKLLRSPNDIDKALGKVKFPSPLQW